MLSPPRGVGGGVGSRYAVRRIPPEKEANGEKGLKRQKRGMNAESEIVEACSRALMAAD